MDFNIWMGMFAPAGTPPNIIALLNKETNRVLQSPDLIEKFKAGGVSAGGGTSEAFAEFVKADYAKWGALVKASGIKLTD
jgi:tripartite-type tricarboxylate transporter receptor subunit TctC